MQYPCKKGKRILSMYYLLYVFLLLMIPTTVVTKPIQQQKKVSTQDKVVCITMPKCGTHLLLKCLSLFDIPRLESSYKSDRHVKPSPFAEALYKRVNQFDPPNHFKGRLHIPTVGPLPKILISAMAHSNQRLFWYHWPYTPEAEDFFARNTLSNFFIIRDPRAMLVSMAHMVKDGWHGEHANVENIIWDFIDGRQKHFIRWGVTVHEAYPLIWELGVTDFYKLYLPWMKSPHFYTVRFEHLIGAKGNGSDALQLQEIKNIANHIGVQLTAEKILHIRNQLFGGTITFREGKTGGWKSHFTPEMKAAYKAVPGACQLLIDLGYEKDDAW